MDLPLCHWEKQKRKKEKKALSEAGFEPTTFQFLASRPGLNRCAATKASLHLKLNQWKNIFFKIKSKFTFLLFWCETIIAAKKQNLLMLTSHCESSLTEENIEHKLAILLQTAPACHLKYLVFKSEDMCECIKFGYACD